MPTKETAQHRRDRLRALFQYSETTCLWSFALPDGSVLAFDLSPNDEQLDDAFGDFYEPKPGFEPLEF